MGTEARTRLGLGALLGVTLLAWAQLFADEAYRGPVLLGIVLAWGVVLAARRLGAGTLVTLTLSAGALVWYVCVVFESRHLLYGLPTPEAIRHLARAVSNSYAFISIDYAPIPLRTGYVVMAVVAMWVAATVGEIATFKWRRPLLASFPPIALFALLMIVGDRRGAAFYVATFLAALLTYWALEAGHSLRSWGRWVPTWPNSTEEAGVPTGGLARRMGLSCVAAALVAPLFLPALGDGLLSWQTDVDGGPGFGLGSGRVDFLVSIKPRLVEQSDVELFRVRSPNPAYWRLVTLVNFDGQSWFPRGNPGTSVGGGIVPSVFDKASRGKELEQTYTLTNLEGNFLPAAVTPLTIDPGDERLDDVRALQETSDLAIENGIDDDFTYTVHSIVADISYRRLRNATAGIFPEQGPYLVLPPGISPRIAELAHSWTDGVESPGGKLIALQQHLRQFTYSTAVDATATDDYLLEFLTETQIGYCQQFATAFAVLARELGFPARVAVGFLPGETSPDAPNEYVVRGTDAHAWPEVYLEGYGWVAFEPTPRSEAAPPAHTVPPVNIAGSPGVNFGRPGFQITDIRENPNNQRSGPPPQLEEPLAPVGTLEPPPNPAWKRAFGAFAIVLAILMGSVLLAIPALKEWRILRRYRRAKSPAAIAAAAFADFEDSAGQLVSRRSAAESAAAYARRVMTTRKLATDQAARLAAIFEAAEYAPIQPPSEHAREAKVLVRHLRARLWSSSSVLQRASRLFSPRGLGLLGRP